MMFFETENLRDGEIRLVLHHTNPADPTRFGLPTYYFRLCDEAGQTLGWCDFRVGTNEDTGYAGHVGYQIEPPFRGRHYAGKAVRLLLKLAAMHGMDHILITCDPENAASAKPCLWAGGQPCGTVLLPADHPLYEAGVRTAERVFRFET